MTIKIAWIGCGRHANEMLLPQLTRYDIELVTLCDVNEENLARTGRRYGVRDLTRDAREAIGRNVDAIGMAMGPDQHFEFGTLAIERGLPLFLEKPPAATAAQASAMAAKARAPVVVGFMKRYSTANRIAINITREKSFGPPASFLGQYMTAPTYFAGNPDYTGFYLHHCVHYFDLVPHLMGPVAKISARRHELSPGKLLLHVDFAFASGAIGTLVMGTHQSRGTPMEWWQVMGDHARVEVRNVHEVRHFRAPKFKVDDPAATLTPSEDTLVWEPNLTVAANEDHKGYHALLGAFLARVRSEAVEVPDLAAGASALGLLERAVG